MSDVEPFAGPPIPVTFDPGFIAPDIALSNNNLTATRTKSTPSQGPGAYIDYVTALCLPTASLGGKFYAEVTLHETGVGDCYVGIANQQQTLQDVALTYNSWLGTRGNVSIGWSPSYPAGGGSVWLNANNLPAVTFPATSGNVLGIALDVIGQTVQFRNVTTASAWSQLYSIAAISPPYRLGVTLYANTESATVNFAGAFVGTAPPGYGPWITPTTPLPPGGGSTTGIVVPATVPPSVAGITQPVFATGSPTVPAGTLTLPTFAFMPLAEATIVNISAVPPWAGKTGNPVCTPPPLLTMTRTPPFPAYPS